jgi:hypothetical protein
MRAYIATIPFALLLASVVGLLVVGDEAAGVSVMLGRTFIVAAVLCLLCVPTFSKKSLILGYVALLLPFGAFAILGFFTKPEVTVTVTKTEESEIHWDKDPAIAFEEFTKALEAKKKKPNQALEPTPTAVTDPAAQAPRQP